MTKTEQAEIKSKLQLYYTKGTRSTRPRWLLEELEAPYELIHINLKEKEHKQDKYRTINPMGKVPVLQDGTQIIRESAAICLHLADKFIDQGLAPSLNSPHRGSYYQWITFAIATVEPAIIEEMRKKKCADQGIAYLPIHGATTEFSVAANTLEDHLNGKNFILGEHITAADIMLGSVMIWAQNMHLLEQHPVIQHWATVLSERPAYNRAT